ncbi:MAG: tyrosine-type recombinase/integrase, partial [Roseobacter sp.]
EIQSARVKDLAHRRLTVNGKTGERTMVLSTTADTFFTELAQGCDDPDRWLLLDHDGEQWDGDAANWRFKQACKIAGLPPEASLYTARHSYITRHLVKAVPVMAIAQQCGTSLSMIEATYANFISDQREAWFDG